MSDMLAYTASATIVFPFPNHSVTQRGFLPRPIQVKLGCCGSRYFTGTGFRALAFATVFLPLAERGALPINSLREYPRFEAI